ncbi:HalOD1 output domain-containing protein [Natrarchaeobaculum aegyptiacum]|uniref:Halobacterial output domain-containing protein n=1 Tax=Natrarchaeobaculum aegyptiacum TaxID=745377 RepID=A0A2Z2HP57_9EURY|nr:HalOD1 output domain-containing protein [Natrarchaeobaculum aegyptiacum]ARS88323.1 hypothetical protein B1756_00140 [Natrarchaeobaculum aegyptiacum]
MEGGDSVDETVTKPPSQTVIDAVADAEGIDPADLRPPAYDPLHAVVDPDSLDALFSDRADGAPRPTGCVTFSYCGYVVTVASDGSVVVRDPADVEPDE